MNNEPERRYIDAHPDDRELYGYLDLPKQTVAQRVVAHSHTVREWLARVLEWIAARVRP